MINQAKIDQLKKEIQIKKQSIQTLKKSAQYIESNKDEFSNLIHWTHIQIIELTKIHQEKYNKSLEQKLIYIEWFLNQYPLFQLARFERKIFSCSSSILEIEFDQVLSESNLKEILLRHFQADLIHIKELQQGFLVHLETVQQTIQIFIYQKKEINSNSQDYKDLDKFLIAIQSIQFLIQQTKIINENDIENQLELFDYLSQKLYFLQDQDFDWNQGWAIAKGFIKIIRHLQTPNKSSRFWMAQEQLPQLASHFMFQMLLNQNDPIGQCILTAQTIGKTNIKLNQN